jgi:hypothetical protein
MFLVIVPPENLKSNLETFVTFAQSLKGDEKSEAQSFLDQFFRALGHRARSKWAQLPNFASPILPELDGASLQPFTTESAKIPMAAPTRIQGASSKNTE